MTGFDGMMDHELSAQPRGTVEQRLIMRTRTAARVRIQMEEARGVSDQEFGYNVMPLGTCDELGQMSGSGEPVADIRVWVLVHVLAHVVVHITRLGLELDRGSRLPAWGV